MDLTVKPEYRQFRDEVRAFLEENLTADLREAGRLATSVFHDVERSMAWQKILNKKGWAAPHWPKNSAVPAGMWYSARSSPKSPCWPTRRR